MLNDSIQATRDYFFAATYRKLDAIRVPAFEQGTPGEIAPLLKSKKSVRSKQVVNLKQYFSGERLIGSGQLNASINDMNALSRLSLLLKYSVSRLRFEPENNYQLHTAVPSPRSIFPIGVYLTVNQETHKDVYRYDRDNYRLTHLTQEDKPLAEEPGNLSIMLVAELEKIVSYYGDFSGYLIGLESGHLVAQMSLLMDALNLNGCIDSQPDDDTLTKLALSSDNHLKLMATIEFDASELPNVLSQLTAKTAEQLVAVEHNAGVDEQLFPVLKRYLDTFNKTKPVQKAELRKNQHDSAESLASPYDIEQLIRLHEDRTSGNDKNGLIAKKNALAVSDFDKILEKIVSLKKQTYASVFANTVASVGIYISITSVNGGNPRTLFLAGNGTSFEIIDEQSPVNDLQRTALSPIGAYNYDNFSCVFSFSVNLAECIKEQGNYGAQEALLAIGYAAQLCISAVTEFGLFSRPIKALDEAQVETMLQTKDNIIYQLICGAKVADQLQYRMA